jgi:hypothetical protein
VKDDSKFIFRLGGEEKVCRVGKSAVFGRNMKPTEPPKGGAG